MLFHFHHCRLSVGISLLLVSIACGAEPSMESLTPRVLQRGVTSEVKFVGAGLAECRELQFYSPGIRCSKLQVIDDYSLIATLEVDANCRITAHPFRLRSDDGFSELRTLHVSRFPVVLEPARKSANEVVTALSETADSNPAKAVTIVGVLQDGDYDRYSVALKKGQRLTAEVEAIRLGGELLDTVLTVTDPSGQVVAINDDGSLLHQDPHLSLIADQEGAYTVEVRESNYGGSATSQYALHLGSFPPVSVAYPAGGQAGQTIAVKLLTAKQLIAADKNDDTTQVQRVVLPVDASEFQLFATDDFGTSATPIPFRVSAYPNVLEHEPNDKLREDLGSSDAVGSVPNATVAFNGILQQPGDVDYFPFQAVEGESLRIETFAYRIGSPVDSLLYLFDATGRLLVQNDDNGSHDSCIEWTAPTTGVYWIAIQDKLKRGWADGVYRIELEQTKPALTAFLPRPDRKSQRKQTISVPQGNRVLAKVGLLREGVHGTPTQLRFADLPAGVQASPVYVSPNDFWALVIVEANADAALGGSLSQVIPSVELPGQAVNGGFRQVVDLIAESADRLYEAATVDRLAVAVTPAVPFSVEVLQPQTALSLGGTLDLVVRVNRTGLNSNDLKQTALKSAEQNPATPFAAPIKIEFPFLPDGCVSEPFIIIDGDKSEGIFRISASPDAQAGDYKLAAVASVHLTDTRNRSSRSGGKDNTGSEGENWFRFKDREIATQLIDLTIATSPITSEFEPMAVEQGGQLKVRCKLAKQGQVPDELLCELEGLPNRIVAKAFSQASSAEVVEFDVQVPRDAPLGTFANIQCRLSGELQGSQVSFVVASQDDLQVNEPGKLFRADDGRMLSPLEALRKQNAKQ